MLEESSSKAMKNVPVYSKPNAIAFLKKSFSSYAVAFTKFAKESLRYVFCEKSGFCKESRSLRSRGLLVSSTSFLTDCKDSRAAKTSNYGISSSTIDHNIPLSMFQGYTKDVLLSEHFLVKFQDTNYDYFEPVSKSKMLSERIYSSCKNQKPANSPPSDIVKQTKTPKSIILAFILVFILLFCLKKVLKFFSDRKYYRITFNETINNKNSCSETEPIYTYPKSRTTTSSQQLCSIMDEFQNCASNLKYQYKLNKFKQKDRGVKLKDFRIKQNQKFAATAAKAFAPGKSIMLENPITDNKKRVFECLEISNTIYFYASNYINENKYYCHHANNYGSVEIAEKFSRANRDMLNETKSKKIFASKQNYKQVSNNIYVKDDFIRNAKQNELVNLVMSDSETVMSSYYHAGKMCDYETHIFEYQEKYKQTYKRYLEGIVRFEKNMKKIKLENKSSHLRSTDENLMYTISILRSITM